MGWGAPDAPPGDMVGDAATGLGVKRVRPCAGAHFAHCLATAVETGLPVGVTVQEVCCLLYQFHAEIEVAAFTTPVNQYFTCL